MVSSDRIFDAAFAAATHFHHVIAAEGEPYAGEYVFAQALFLTSEILADVLSVCPERQRNARRRLEQLLTSSERESS